VTYKQLLKQTIANLQDRELESSVRFLLLAYCQQANIDLYADYDLEVDVSIIDKFHQAVVKLCDNQPLGYILGYETFYGYDFVVNESVFIPRNETEELVNEILMILDESPDQLTGLDIGTGSGVIAITLNKEKPSLAMYACDISQTALNLAIENANKLSASVAFVLSDLFEKIPGNKKFDFIVCNPPYIKNDELLSSSVVDFEPHTALFGGKDGLDFYRKILSQAKDYLEPNSFLAFEIGYDQAAAVIAIVKENFVDAEIELKQDINGKDRMIFVFNNWR